MSWERKQAEEALDLVNNEVKELKPTDRARFLKLVPQYILDGSSDLEGGEEALALDEIRFKRTNEAEQQFLFNLACRLLHK